jgi:hypothetical protein
MLKLTKSIKGIAMPVLVLIIVVVLAAAGIVFWQITKKSSPSSSTSNSSTAKTVAVSPTCEKSFNDNKLCAFAEHMYISTMEYVATGTATNASGNSSKYTIKNDAKGNKEITYTSGSQQISTITLNGVSYYQEGAGTTWLEYSNGGAPATISNPVSGFNFNLSGTTAADLTVTKEGTSACGNLTCYEYKVIDSKDPGGIAYIYFDNQNYLLRHWTSHNTTSGISVDLTFSYPSVTIAIPSPVQQITT